ncbi:MAG: flagellar FliJ family protein [Gammaproteobacteria bacterium]|nr:flagellar FliJ family protein [Gammaproteobacteria bacterium]
MKKFKQLSTASHIKEAVEKKKAQEIAVLLTQKKAMDAQLKELVNYCEEFARKNTLAQLNGGMGITELQIQRAFLNRVSAAIEYQNKQISQLMQKIDQLVSEWQRAHIDQKALHKMLLLLQKEEEQSEDRQVQNESDDRAIQQFLEKHQIS